jgi:hypothetical protein
VPSVGGSRSPKRRFKAGYSDARAYDAARVDVEAGEAVAEQQDEDDEAESRAGSRRQHDPEGVRQLVSFSCAGSRSTSAPTRSRRAPI